MNAIQRLSTLPMLTLLGIGLLLYEPAARATTYVVNPAGGGDYTTIAAAVSAANPLGGDIIQVVGGTNTESNITLDRPVTLQGAQAGVDARTRGPGGVPDGETVMSSPDRIFNLNSTNIVIDGFFFPNLGQAGFKSVSNPDNLTIRNSLFLTQIGNCEGGGNIHFEGGGDPVYHAHGFLFEQNHVIENTTNECGYFLYNGHLMDGGTIRNNYIQSRYFALGPFGARTGWVIEGNEFDGNMVPGSAEVLAPYRGSGFNAHLGDVLIQKNYIHHMRNGLGFISVVGGRITSNHFENNGLAFALLGGEWGSMVSTNVVIDDNRLTYNGLACTSYDNAAHGVWIRPPFDPDYAGIDPGNPEDPNGIDASSIHILHNCFLDLGVGTCAQAWAIRQNGYNVLDAELNHWGTSNAESVASMIGQGDADQSPYLTGIQYSGALNFNPSDPIQLSAVVDGTEGPVSGVAVSFYLGGSWIGEAVTDGTGLASYNLGILPAGAYSVVASSAGGCLMSVAASITVTSSISPTSLEYTGPSFFTMDSTPLVLTGLLSSDNPDCVTGQDVEFYINGSLLGSAVVQSDGTFSLPATLEAGVYELSLAFLGSNGCSSSSTETTAIEVLAIGDSACGKGWYRPAGKQLPRASFEFKVQGQNQKKHQGHHKRRVYQDTGVRGELTWTSHRSYQLKSVEVTRLIPISIEGYAKAQLIHGRGELRRWNSETKTWSEPEWVDYVATIADGGDSAHPRKRDEDTDAFGISIPGIYTDPVIPVVLRSGEIEIDGTHK